MQLTVANPALNALIEAEWCAHFADSLRGLRETPSGRVRRACDVLADPATPWKLPFALRLAAGETSLEERRAFFHATDAMERQLCFDTQPVDGLRGSLPVLLGRAEDPKVRALLTAEFEAIGSATRAKAAAIRPLLFPLLKQHFGAAPSSLGGGEYRLAIPTEPLPLELWLDFGGRSKAVRWGISPPPASIGRRGPVHWSYEQLLGIATSNWDLMRSDRVEAETALLAERIIQTAELLRSVTWTVPET